MIRFSPLAAARCNTSSVAIMVTAIPVTRVLGSPALNVSTVCAIHGIPTRALTCSITSFAVGAAEFADRAAGEVAVFCAFTESDKNKVAAVVLRNFMGPRNRYRGEFTSIGTKRGSSQENYRKSLVITVK